GRQRYPGVNDFTVNARRLLAHSEIERLRLKSGEVRAWSWTHPGAQQPAETATSLRERGVRWMSWPPPHPTRISLEDAGNRRRVHRPRGRVRACSRYLCAL